MNIELKFEHPKMGMVKTAPMGFSWTTLFFWFIPAACRGDIKWALLQFLIGMLTGGISVWVFPFIYNKMFITGLIGQGYKCHEHPMMDIQTASFQVGITIPAYEKD